MLNKDQAARNRFAELEEVMGNTTIDHSAAINNEQTQIIAGSSFAALSDNDRREIHFRHSDEKIAEVRFGSNFSSMDINQFLTTDEELRVTTIDRISHGERDYYFATNDNGLVELSHVEIPEGTQTTGLLTFHRPAEAVRMTDEVQRIGYELYGSALTAIDKSRKEGLLHPSTRCSAMDSVCEQDGQLYSIDPADPFTQMVKTVSSYGPAEQEGRIEEYKVVRARAVDEFRFHLTDGAQPDLAISTIDELAATGLINSTDAEMLRFASVEDPLRHEATPISGRRELSLSVENGELVVTLPKAYQVQTFGDDGVLRGTMLMNGLIPFKGPDLVEELADIDRRLRTSA